MTAIAVTLASHYLPNPSNVFNNVFGFETSGGDITDSVWEDFVDAWVAGVLTAIRAVTGSDMRYDSLIMRGVNHDIPERETFWTPPYAGSVGGDGLPGFVAWGFQYQRFAAGQRSGAKRFGYVPESQQDGVGPTAGALTLLNTLATALNTPITVDAVTFTPGIIHKTGPSTGVIHETRGVVFKRLTTQNSRKR